MAQDEIKNNLGNKKLILGTERIIKALKNGSIAKVFLSLNCPDSVKQDIKYYAGLSKTEIEELTLPNDELGVLCKKPFSVSVLGILK